MSAAGQCDTARIVSPLEERFAFFGGGVAVSGDLAAVGGLGPNHARTAYLLERSAQGWVRTQTVTSGQRVSSFSNHLALQGSTLLLANIDDQSDAGSVSAFERVSGTFVPRGTLRSSLSPSGSHFGRRLALDGDRAVIAAPMDATYAYRGGAVLVFERTAGQWTETARIDPPIVEWMGFFGLSVALEGELLVVGHPGHVLGGVDVNSAHVYRLVGGVWTLEETLWRPYGPAFGYCVDIAGGAVFVGAFREGQAGATNRGVVHEYHWSPAGWQIAQSVWGDPLGAADGFGRNFVCDGTRLVVSCASAELGGASDVHVLRRAGNGGWVVDQELPGSPPPPVFSPAYLGAALALSGDDVWVGAPAEPSAAGIEGVGAVYLFDLGPVTTEFCAGVGTNSTGAIGELQILGCAAAGASPLVVRASSLPPLTVGMLLVSRQQGLTPIGAGVTLCLGGRVGRYSAQVASTGPTGSFDTVVDLGSLPVPAGGTVALPGESLHFQAWFRDSAPAVQVTRGLGFVVR